MTIFQAIYTVQLLLLITIAISLPFGSIKQSSILLSNHPLHHSSALVALASTSSSSEDLDNTILRKVQNWACIKQCGACCKLGPLDSRPDLETYLSPDQFKQYVSMIGPDNWCINYDQKERLCKIYEDRPLFCRVDVQQFQKMYDIEEEEFSDFCAFCCREHITDVFGEESEEMERFDDVMETLNEEESK
eukprot:gene5124-5630_t